MMIQMATATSCPMTIQAGKKQNVLEATRMTMSKTKSMLQKRSREAKSTSIWIVVVRCWRAKMKLSVPEHQDATGMLKHR